MSIRRTCSITNAPNFYPIFNSLFLIPNSEFRILNSFYHLGHDALCVVAQRGLANFFDLVDGVLGAKGNICRLQHGKVVFLVAARHHEQIFPCSLAVQLFQASNAGCLAAALDRQLQKARARDGVLKAIAESFDQVRPQRHKLLRLASEHQLEPLPRGICARPLVNGQHVREIGRISRHFAHNVHAVAVGHKAIRRHHAHAHLGRDLSRVFGHGHHVGRGHARGIQSLARGKIQQIRAVAHHGRQRAQRARLRQHARNILMHAPRAVGELSPSRAKLGNCLQICLGRLCARAEERAVQVGHDGDMFKDPLSLHVSKSPEAWSFRAARGLKNAYAHPWSGASGAARRRAAFAP